MEAASDPPEGSLELQEASQAVLSSTLPTPAVADPGAVSFPSSDHQLKTRQRVRRKRKSRRQFSGTQTTAILGTRISLRIMPQLKKSLCMSISNAATPATI